MKARSIKKSFLVVLVVALLAVVSSAVLAACDTIFDGANDKLTNSSGFAVEGGGFEQGAVLQAILVDSESEDYATAISAIEGCDYNKTKPVYVIEVSVTQDGVKVQPNGKVKVTVPVSGDLTDYQVLHVKDDGTVEKLALTYKNGKVTFETDSFSKFVLVKKSASLPDGGSGDNDGGNDDGGNQGGGDVEVTKYNLYTVARRIVSAFLSEGGAVRNADDEDITYMTLSLAEGTEFTLKSFCYPDYYFVGWYEATEREEATEDKLLSTESTYIFTVEKDLNVCALYAHKSDAVRLTLDADGYGFSYRDGKPTLTLVSKDSTDVPMHDYVDVFGWLGDGSVENFGCPDNWSFSNNMVFDDGGVDYTKVGTYTLTYSYKYNANVKATLEVQVVDSAHTLSVSTSDNNLKFRYDVSGETNSIEKILPQGRLVTLTAEPKNGYAFAGWYNQADKLVSTELVYCFEMPDSDVTLHGEYEASSTALTFTVMYDQGQLLDALGNACTWSGTETVNFKTGEKITLTIREKDYYEFVGWYDVTNDKNVLLTEDKTLSLTVDETMSVWAKFREKLKYVEIDSTTLSNEGFVDGKLAMAIGDEAVDYKNFEVNAKGWAGSYGALLAEDYVIDDGALDFGKVGTYTITYTYKYDTSINTQLTIVVVDAQKAKFEFAHSHSYLDHKFDGKATFVSLMDIKVDDVTLYQFKSDSKIWDRIAYRWIDKTTKQEVDTTDVDVTINGVVVKNFGSENYKMTIGNEFGGPIKAGSYTFELLIDGETALTKDSTISTDAFQKITSKDEFKTNEGSSWLTFKLYYYAIVGYADGEYFVMQMPSIGYDNGGDAPARKAKIDADGKVIVGEGNDFVFVNARYYANEKTDCTEFLTGYYGSYVLHSSDSTTDGTLMGSPYIYRTGYTCVSGGKIYREYGNKEYYGNKTEFAEDGAVTIYSRYYGQTANNRLRLVKDGDKYVFTSVPADTDTRQSFDIFIYSSIIQQDVEDGNK